MFSNSGNYGLPVVLFAFGSAALAQAMVYFVANAILTYTVGVFIASAGRRSAVDALKGVLRVPVVYAVVAAGIVKASGIVVPLAVMRPIGLLSDAALPVMVLVLGMQLERGEWPSRPALVAIAAVLSLVVTPLLALAAARALSLSGAARQAAIIQSGMPSAVLTTILALEFDVEPAFVTACVIVSTLASPLTVTLLIALLKERRRSDRNSPLARRGLRVPRRRRVARVRPLRRGVRPRLSGPSRGPSRRLSPSR